MILFSSIDLSDEFILRSYMVELCLIMAMWSLHDGSFNLNKPKKSFSFSLLLSFFIYFLLFIFLCISITDII